MGNRTVLNGDNRVGMEDTERTDHTTMMVHCCCRLMSTRRRRREEENAEINDRTHTVYLYKDIHRKTNWRRKQRKFCLFLLVLVSSPSSSFSSLAPLHPTSTTRTFSTCESFFSLVLYLYRIQQPFSSILVYLSPISLSLTLLILLRRRLFAHTDGRDFFSMMLPISTTGKKIDLRQQFVNQESTRDDTTATTKRIALIMFSARYCSCCCCCFRVMPSPRTENKVDCLGHCFDNWNQNRLVLACA